MNKAKKIKADIVVTLGMTIFSIYIYIMASGFPREAGLFPKLVSTLVIVLCILQLVLSALNLSKVLKSEDKQESKIKSSNKDFLITIITLIAYPVLIFVIGYIPSTLFYLAFAMYSYGYRKRVGIALISVGVTIFLYVVFALVLRVNLPVGLLLGGF